METIAVVFLVVNGVLLFILPRRWAPLPLLIGTCYMPVGQMAVVGPFHFNIVRILIAVGFLRVLVRGERIYRDLNALDWLVLAWGVWALISSYFHSPPSEALVFRLGITYNIVGTYFLMRIFCRTPEDLVRIGVIIAIVLLPVSIMMLYEKLKVHNLFIALGGIGEPEIREGTVRARGPFSHPILAGTVGAACTALMGGLYQFHRKIALAGIFACFAMTYASGSSGPVLSALAGIGALYMWRYRGRMQLIRRLAVVAYLALMVVMKSPPYYLLERMDVVGGSTGWYRAHLIEMSITHLNEWWLAGTDFTRHWMPTGVTWNPEHTDITNYYIQMGVWGGLPLTILLIAMLVKAFSYIGQIIQRYPEEETDSAFLVWSIGAALFAHVVTCTSVSYFDQSFLFFWTVLAMIGSLRSFTSTVFYPEFEPEESDEDAVYIRGYSNV